jgi:serine/threonine protein kinase/WD40 repeat protein
MVRFNGTLGKIPSGNFPEYIDRVPTVSQSDKSTEQGWLSNDDKLEAQILEGLKQPACGVAEADAVAVKVFSLLHEKEQPRTDQASVGDFELLQELGRGGMGIVFRARQKSLNRTVALKMLLSGRFVAPELLKRFQVEAEAAAILDHPNIVPVFEVGETNGIPFYCMKYLDGSNLAQQLSQWDISKPELIKTEIRAREIRIAAILRTLAKAIHYAHQRGILHRDLKPSNVLIDSAGEPHITDFGLAKLVDGPADVTMTGAILGTPAYMSPEQAAGNKLITTATDIYGLGAILYELLVGRPPYSSDSSANTLRLVLETEPKKPRSAVKDLSRDLESICLKCLAREPKDRYASADAVAEDLSRFIRGEPILARPPASHERVWKWVKRKPAFAALVGLASTAALVFLVGLIISNVLIGQARTAAEAALEQQNQGNYIKTVSLSHRELQQGDPSRALELLATCDPKRRAWEWNFLQRSAEGNVRRWPIAQDVVFDVEAASSGKFLALLTSKSDFLAKPQHTDVEVLLVNPDTGETLHRMEAPGLSLDAPMVWWSPRLAISRGSHFLAISGTIREDGKLHGAVRCFDGTRSWQPKKLKIDLFRDQIVMGVFFDHLNGLYALTYDFADSGDRDAPVEYRVVDLQLGKTKFTFTSGGRHTSQMVNRDGKYLVVAGSPMDMIDFETGEVLPPVDLHQLARFPRNMKVSGDDKYIACVENYGRLVVFDFATRKKIREIQAHVDGAYDLAFTAMNKEIITVGEDGAVKRWRISDGELLDERYLGDPIFFVAVHPKSGVVFAPEAIGGLAAWDPTESDALRSRDLREGLYTPVQMEFSGDGKRVFDLESGMALSVWDAESKAIIRSIDFLKYYDHDIPSVRMFAASHDGKRAALLRAWEDFPDRSQAMEVWDIDSGMRESVLPITPTVPTALTWGKDENILVAFTKDKSLMAFDVSERKLVWESAHEFDAWIGRQPRSDRLFVVEKLNQQKQSTMKVIDVKTGAELARHTISRGRLEIWGFSFDGSILLATTIGNRENGFGDETTLIDPETGRILENYFLGSKPRSIFKLQMLADGTRVFTQSRKGDIRVWDRQTHELILNIRNQQTPYGSFAISPQGLVAVGAYHGRGVYLWDGRPHDPQQSQ